MKIHAHWLIAVVAAASASMAAACSTSRHGPDATARPGPDAVPRPLPAGAGIDWQLSPARITAGCGAESRRARARIQSIIAEVGPDAPVRALGAIETAIADMNDALVAHRMLAHAAMDQAVRDASMQCNEALAALGVELAANPAIYALANAARARASTPADAQLAQIYVEAGRRTGAGLDAAQRAEVTRLFEQLGKLEIAYMRALGEDRTTIEISADEAASLPQSFVSTLQASPDGYIVPVHYGNTEQFLASQASGEARKRYYLAFYNRGGQANVDRLEQALALRHRLARLLGFDSWAAYRLDNKMAKTPARAMALVEAIDARLLPRARAEIEALARMKSASGDGTPFAAWDYAYYEEELARTRYGVDAQAVRQYFPVDAVVPAVLDLYGTLLGVTFRPVSPANAWAPDVLAYSITDSAGGEPMGWFFLDLLPRAGKGLHFSHHGLRPGRVLPGGGYQKPIAAVIGNGPAAEPGKPALLSHKDVVIFFHEFGHLMHDTLSTAPYATLYGTNVRGDFVEAPSQMLENWIWQPSILKKISSHVVTGEPLPDQLIAKMIARQHVADGAFWTRQAFFGIYDMTLHSAGPKVDTTRLWLELTARLMALPPAPGTIPQASFAGFMGGYDAGYYGYLWSKVYAQDMFTVFAQGGLENPEIGRRYRREILEPGGTREPEALLERFLGRPVRFDAFYQALGIGP